MILLCCFCFSRALSCIADSCFLLFLLAVVVGVLYPEAGAEVAGVAFCRDPGSSSKSGCWACFSLPFIVTNAVPLCLALLASSESCCCEFFFENDDVDLALEDGRVAVLTPFGAS